jgi:addiction module HigA family antidote
MSVSRAELDSGQVDFADVADDAAIVVAPLTPGELLREEWLGPLGVSGYRLAKEIGVPAHRVTGILAGKKAITADTALRLARYFGTDAQSRMNLQTNYDLEVQRRDSGAEIERVVRPLQRPDDGAGPAA